MCYGCENALSSMKHKKSFLSIECYHKYVIRQTEVVQLQSMSFCFFFVPLQRVYTNIFHYRTEIMQYLWKSSAEEAKSQYTNQY